MLCRSDDKITANTSYRFDSFLTSIDTLSIFAHHADYRDPALSMKNEPMLWA